MAKNTLSQTLNDLREAFVGLPGENLVALVRYGELSRLAPIQILIVLKQVDLEKLRQIQEAYHTVKTNHPISPMVATLEEIDSSTDVFPVTFLEMKQSYEVLLGEDVLADLDVANEHLRLRCEQELKNLLLRMQTAFLRQRDPIQRAEACGRFWNAFMRSLGASLMLTGHSWPDDQLKTIQIAADEMSVDGDALQDARKIALGNRRDSPDELEQAWMVMIQNAAIAARFVDQLPVHCLAVEILDSEGDN